MENNNIASALISAQKKISNAHKDSKNPHFKSKYASLESVIDAVKDEANEAGIAIIQSGGKDSEGHFIETTLMHSSGEMISSKVYLVLDKQNMQGLGSATTYARRYGLAGLFAIGQDDDDAESTMNRNQEQPKKEIKHVSNNEKTGAYNSFNQTKVGMNNGNRNKNEL